MPDIALRTYLDEIDGMIDGSRVDEAIAHLKHILGIYPKNLEAYRLLAKGLLEKNKHLDAADVFQRVLSSVPDDFIAHVGMAVVREDEGNMDAAIWHMERAFEVQPSNGPVQEELRRLYGKRDGGELPRLRLSRAALARMYEKGSLYPQAIAEARWALTEDPDRLDLKVLLATSLWRMRQRIEAAEASAKLLEVLPYCREANRILAHVWDEEGHPDEAKNYKRRLEALDPYEAFTDPSQNGTGSSLVPSDQVQVPRLENVYGETTTDASRPDWMEALGIQYESTPAAAPETQDWMNVISPPASGAGGEAPATSPDQPNANWLEAIRGTGMLTPPGATAMPEPDVPDWMRSSVAEPPPAASAAPDWLAGLAPADENAEQPTQPQTAVPGSDWLSDLFAVQGAGAARGGKPEAPAPTEAETPEAPPPAPGQSQSTGMTGWLEALQGDTPEAAAPVAPTAAAAPPEAAPSSSDEEVPEWLHAAANVDESAPTADSDVPDWIRTSAAADTTDPGLPDWLGGSPDVDAEQPTAYMAQAGPGVAEPVEAAQPSEALPEWLQTLPPAEEDLGLSDLPDWLTPADDTTLSAPRRAEPEPAPVPPPADDLPAWLTQHEPPADTGEAGDIPDWLKASAAEAPAEPVQPRAAYIEPPARLVENRSADLPDWLQSSAVAEESTFEASVPAPEDIPAWLRLQPADEATTAEVPAWLRVPAEPEAEQPDEPPMSAEQKAAIMEQAAEEIPDWMSEAGWAPRDPTIPLDSAPGLAEPVDAGLVDAELVDAELVDAELVDAELVEAEVESVEQGEVLGDTEPEPAELPDWLRAMKPPEELITPAVHTPRAAADTPDWLRAAMEGNAPPDDTPLSEAEPEPPAREVTAADVPAWLQTASSDPGDTIVSFLKSKPKTETGSLTPLPEGYKPADAPEIPDWLRTAAEPPTSEIKTAPFDSISETGPLEAPPPPDEPVVALPAAAEPLEAADPNNMTADEALAWLENLAARQGANEEELVTKRADLPWLRQPAEPVAGAEPAQPPAEPVAAAPAEPADVAEPAPAEAAEALPDWLRLPDEGAEAAPAWLRAATEQTTPAEEMPTPPPVAAEPAPAEPAPNFQSDDDAIAWLESLAAKQGAAPEELVTRPEQRLDELPEWLREPATMSDEAHRARTEPLTPAVDEPVAEAAPQQFEMETAAEPEPQLEAPAPIEAEATEAVPAASMSDDQALAWLESLAVKQGANAEELVTQPESRPEELPDWLKAQLEAVESMEPVIPAVGESPAGLAAEEFELAEPMEQQAELAGPEAEPVEPKAELVEAKPAWLSAMEAESDQYEATLRAEPEQPAAPEPAEVAEDAALAWLESLALKQGARADELVSKPEARAAEMPEWVKAEAEAMAAEPEPVEFEDEPADAEPADAELADAEPAAAPLEAEPLTPLEETVEAPSLAKWLEPAPIETEPVVEPPEPPAEPAEPIPAWLAEESVAPSPEPPVWISPTAEPPPVKTFVTPEPVSEPAPSAPAHGAAPRIKLKSTSRPPRQRPGVAKPAILRRTEAPEVVLALAREHLTGDKVKEALEVYDELINANHLLDDIISDLEAAMPKHSDKPELLRTLGDAYMRDNQLQRALDTYKQALKRL